MEHFYQNIPGWFNFQELYSSMIAKVNGYSHFVEVGCFLGKSSSFMAVEIINSGKDIEFDIVDSFNWIPPETDKKEYINKEGGNIYQIFLKNIEPAMKGVENVWKMDSVFASKLYNDNELDFVFIDADHTTASVKADIDAWYPKIKEGGVLAGHDIYWDGVKKAVLMKFESYDEVNNCWVINKNGND